MNWIEHLTVARNEMAIALNLMTDENIDHIVNDEEHESEVLSDLMSAVTEAKWRIDNVLES